MPSYGHYDSSIRSWIIPVTLGLLATIIYRFYFQSH